MKVTVFEAELWEQLACRRLEPTHVVSCTADSLTEETVVAYRDTEIVSTFIHSRLNAEVLVQLPALKLIVTRSTGHDHIDLGWCTENGVVVSNVPDYGTSTVAEHAFALLLAVARNLVDAVERTRQGHFSQTGLRGIELRGKTLGVIGTGRIGQCAIAIAQGFGMVVVAHDPVPNDDAATRLGFRYTAFDEVLRLADVLMLHLPANPGTVNLIGDREFGLMKSGAILINTARGNVVDLPALVRALTDRRLRGAGLDVLPQEAMILEDAQILRTPASSIAHDIKRSEAQDALLGFPNVIVTPHNAYNTDRAVRRIIETTIANIDAFTAGAPHNVVTNA